MHTVRRSLDFRFATVVFALLVAVATLALVLATPVVGVAAEPVVAPSADPACESGGSESSTGEACALPPGITGASEVPSQGTPPAPVVPEGCNAAAMNEAPCPDPNSQMFGGDDEHALGNDPGHTYRVRVCNKDFGYANNAMWAYNNGGYMHNFSTCYPVGGYGLQAGVEAPPGSGYSGQGAEAYWILTAPGGTHVVGFDMYMDCDAVDGWSSSIFLSQYDTNVVPGYGDQGNYCHTPPPGGTTGNTFTPYWSWFGGVYSDFRIGARCEYQSSCSNYWGFPFNAGQAGGRDISIYLQDYSAPNLYNVGPSSALWQGQWSSANGTQTIPLDTTDSGGGLKNLRLVIDGNTAYNYDYGCDYTYTVPCSVDGTNGWVAFNGSSLSDGEHQATIQVTDAGDNIVSQSSTLRIDHSAPAAPQDLSVTPGGWSSNDSFKVDWNNPGNQSAPIDGYYYKVGSVPTSATDGTYVDTADGQTYGSIDNAQAGSVGDKPVYVWLKDKAGNVSAVNRADGQLKFDDVAPSDAIPDIKNGWIGKVEADGYLQTWELPLQVPVSSIGGYATSLDQTEGGDPGAAITDPADPQQKTLNINQEGSWYFHVRPISGAGVAGPVDSAELKVDLTDPSSSIEGVPSAEWVNHDVALGLSGADALSGIDTNEPGSGTFYRIDNGQWQAGASIGVSSEGKHTASYRAVDVAGNQEPEHSTSVGVDKSAPVVAFANSEESDDPARLHAVVADQVSGIVGATISYRLKGSDSYTDMPTEVSGSDAQASFPDDQVPEGRYEFKVTATDKAGNIGTSTSRQNGEPMALDSLIRESTHLDAGFEGKPGSLGQKCKKKTRRARSGKRRRAKLCSSSPVFTGLATGIKTAYGKGTTIAGVVRDGSDNPLRYVAIDIYVKQDIPGAEWEQQPTIHADSDGTFVYKVKPGFSRLVRLRYGGNKIRRSAQSKDLQLKVKAKSTFKVTPKRLKNGQLMRFKGRIKLHPGAHIPPGGKLVSLEFLDQRGGKKSWKVAGKVLRTNEKGVIKGRYRFKHVTFNQRIIFSLNTLPEESFPYIPGRSRSQTITVRP